MADVPGAILEVIRERGVRFVRFIWTDNAGLIRAKVVRTDFLGEVLPHGPGIAAAQQSLPATADAGAPGADIPIGEVYLRPDWATFAPLPYAPGHARVIGDAFERGESWAHCARGFARRMLERAGERGPRVGAAFENEFYLLRPGADGGFGPVDRTVFAQTQALDRQAAVLGAIVEALEAQGVAVEQLYAESGGGQFEIPVCYAEGLAAADRQVVFRETVRAVAYEHGLTASFLPKIFPDQAGSGAHLHLSLWREGQNIVPHPEQPGLISAEAEAFVGGLLDHLPGLMALTTPSPNSFKRIRPRSWSGAYTCWGYGNREAAVRIPQPPAGAAATNLELKTVDPTCNPYLALGAALAAGLDGLERGLSPGEPLQRNPADLPDEEREARGIAMLPRNLGEAIAALEQDEVLLGALGPELARSFLAVRRAEWQALRDLPHEQEVALLLERY